jgi:hypothetical protein
MVIKRHPKRIRKQATVNVLTIVYLLSPVGHTTDSASGGACD